MFGLTPDLFGGFRAWTALNRRTLQLGREHDDPSRRIMAPAFETTRKISFGKLIPQSL
jgi:hypothetical protein